MRALLGRLGLILALVTGSAHAQGTVQQSGPIVPFHSLAWFGNGIVADAGTPAIPYLSSVGLFNGPACPFGISSQTSPGASLTAYSQFSICQTATTTTLSIQGANGQATPAFNLNIGGTVYPFPGPGNGNVVGPNSSTVGALTCFNSIGGTLIEVCPAASVTATYLASGAAVTNIGYTPANNVFTQTGTGAVAQTLAGKFGRIVDVVDFGATGNGTTDDTTAIQNAVNRAEATGYTLYLDPGTYKITSPISITSALTVNGAGKSLAILLPTTGIDGIDISTTTAVKLSNFQIQYVVAGTAGTSAISLTAPSSENEESVFRDLFIVNPYYGFKNGATALWRFVDSTIIQTGSASGAQAFKIANSFNADSGDSTIQGVTMEGGAGMTGLAWSSSGGLRVINSKILGYSTAISGLLASGVSTADIIITGNSIEAGGTGGGTVGITISKGIGTRLNELLITGNEIEAVAPIALTDTNAFLNYVSVVGNGIYADSTGPGVEIDGAASAIVTGNTFHSTTTGGTGIKIGASAGPATIGANVYDANTTTQVSDLSTTAQQNGRVLLATYTAAASASLTDITHLTATYSDYEIVWRNIVPATSATSLEFQTYEGGSYQTTSYVNASGGATTYVDLLQGGTLANTAAFGSSGSVRLSNISGATAKAVFGQSVNMLVAPSVSNVAIAGFHNTTTAVTGFRVMMSSGNITSGVMEIYGVP